MNARTLLAPLTVFALLPLGAQAGQVSLTPNLEVANMYLYRGINEGGSNALVSGGLEAGYEGAYAGVQAFSAAGGEYDTYVGYAQELGGVIGVDLSLWTYTIPSDNAYDSTFDYSEAFLTLTWDRFHFTAADNVAGDNGRMYYNLGASIDKFSVGIGLNDPDTIRYPQNITAIDDADIQTDYTHVDVTYAYNDNLRLTLSQVVEQDEFTYAGQTKDDYIDDDLNVVVSYSMTFD